MSRTSIIGLVLGGLFDGPIDVGRVVMMCSIHDLAETRIGDVPSVARPYLKKPNEARVIDDQIDGAPTAVEDLVRGLVQEYEERRTIEALLARDADKLECLAQAMQYSANGNPNAMNWIRSNYEALSTDVARTLADVMVSADPTDWWRDVVVNYWPAGPQLST